MPLASVSRNVAVSSTSISRMRHQATSTFTGSLPATASACMTAWENGFRSAPSNGSRPAHGELVQ